jgi:putative chitinase
MPTYKLQAGSSGDMVSILQNWLNAMVTPAPNLTVDGNFNATTEQVVKNTQGQNDLVVNGIVDPKFWLALGNLWPPRTADYLDVYDPFLNTSPWLRRLFLADPTAPVAWNFDKPTLFDMYRDQYGLTGARQNGLNRLLDFLSYDDAVVDVRDAAYMLATVKWECGDTWQPVLENASGLAYCGRADLGNTVPGDGPRFKGRGYVQITGRGHYTRFSTLLGVDMVANPDLALDPPTSYPILSHGMLEGRFTGAKLGTFTHHFPPNYFDARTVVNAHDQAIKIKRFAQDLEAYLQANITSV